MYPQNEATPIVTPVNPPLIQEHGVSIRDYVDLLIEGRKTIFFTMAVVLSMTVVYLVLAPRVYKADALLRIDKNKADLYVVPI